MIPGNTVRILRSHVNTSSHPSALSSQKTGVGYIAGNLGAATSRRTQQMPKMVVSFVIICLAGSAPRAAAAQSAPPATLVPREAYPAELDAYIGKTLTDAQLPGLAI